MCKSFELQQIVERIENLCAENHIDVKQMLLECGLSRNAVDNMKNGSKPSVDKIQSIADYFEVTTDYLLGNENTLSKPTKEDIKFALFNGSEGITDEMYDEVKQFAEMVKMREEAKRREQK